MDGVNELDENDKISNVLDPDAEKQTFGRKSQNWPTLKGENGILLYNFLQEKFSEAVILCRQIEHSVGQSCSSESGNEGNLGITVYSY
ncbi:hypothetical protein Hanom_Chr11g01047091 [Helianthus anomalus]